MLVENFPSMQAFRGAATKGKFAALSSVYVGGARTSTGDVRTMLRHECVRYNSQRTTRFEPRQLELRRVAGAATIAFFFSTIASSQVPHPLGRFSKRDRSANKKEGANIESIRFRKALGEMLSNSGLFGTDTIIPTVEISSMESRPRGV